MQILEGEGRGDCCVGGRGREGEGKHLPGGMTEGFCMEQGWRSDQRGGRGQRSRWQDVLSRAGSKGSQEVGVSAKILADAQACHRYDVQALHTVVTKQGGWGDGVWEGGKGDPSCLQRGGLGSTGLGVSVGDWGWWG